MAGTTSEAAGSSSTSSKVSPSIAILVGSSPPVGTGTAMGMLLSAIDMGEASRDRHGTKIVYIESIGNGLDDSAPRGSAEQTRRASCGNRWRDTGGAA